MARLEVSVNSFFFLVGCVAVKRAGIYPRSSQSFDLVDLQFVRQWLVLRYGIHTMRLSNGDTTMVTMNVPSAQE